MYYHARLDITIIVYVDDLLIDGDESSIKWFLQQIAERFNVGEPDWLTPTTPIDYLGMEISMDDTRIYVSMPT